MSSQVQKEYLKNFSQLSGIGRGRLRSTPFSGFLVRFGHEVFSIRLLIEEENRCDLVDRQYYFKQINSRFDVVILQHKRDLLICQIIGSIKVLLLSCSFEPLTYRAPSEALEDIVQRPRYAA